MNQILLALLSFSAAAAVLTVTPGLDTVLVLRAAASRGPLQGAAAALGVGAGCLGWGFAAATGLTALLTVSELAFEVMKLAGAAYLVWLGVTSIIHPRRALAIDGQVPTGSDRSGLADAFRRGFLTNMLNPKVGLFYLTFLPLFIPEGLAVGPFSMLLASVHVLLGLIWFALLIGLTVPLGRWLAQPRVVTTLDRVTGILFVGFGIKLALTQRN